MENGVFYKQTDPGKTMKSSQLHWKARQVSEGFCSQHTGHPSEGGSCCLWRSSFLGTIWNTQKLLNTELCMINVQDRLDTLVTFYTFNIPIKLFKNENKWVLPGIAFIFLCWQVDLQNNLLWKHHAQKKTQIALFSRNLHPPDKHCTREMKSSGNDPRYWEGINYKALVST